MIRLSDQDLSHRAKVCLQNYGFEYMEQVVQFQPQSLLNIPNMGKNTVNELEWFAEENGLGWGNLELSEQELARRRYYDSIRRLFEAHNAPPPSSDLLWDLYWLLR